VSDPVAKFFVTLAIYRPQADLLQRQLESLRAQRGVAVRIIAVIDDARSIDARSLHLLEACPDLEIARLEKQSGVRATFLHGLRLALARSEANTLFAFSDQDDVWHPDKLKIQAAALESSSAALCHCDARLVTPDGVVIAPSMHRSEGRAVPRNMFELLSRNIVTGMTMVLRHPAAERLVSQGDGFPARFLHDHVAAMLEFAHGFTFVAEPLVDYVQHSANVIGSRPRPRFRLPTFTSMRVARDVIFAYRRLESIGAVPAGERLLGSNGRRLDPARIGGSFVRRPGFTAALLLGALRARSVT